MTLIELATTIGDVLTKIDALLQTPGLSDSDWQTLYALRKHLDDEQRDLIGESINEADATYQALTTQLKTASDQLNSVISDLTKVGSVITKVSQISNYVDQILKLVAAV
jgi:flagellar biosynthesis chaperone FliJ